MILFKFDTALQSLLCKVEHHSEPVHWLVTMEELGNPNKLSGVINVMNRIFEFEGIPVVVSADVFARAIRAAKKTPDTWIRNETNKD